MHWLSSQLLQSKACLQIHYLNVRKKWILRWLNFREVRFEIKLFTSTWYTALLPWLLLSISSLWFWLDNQSGFSFSVQSHTRFWKSFRFRGSENADYGLNSILKASNGKALLNLMVSNKLQNLPAFIKHCMETFKFLEMGGIMKS